MPGEFCIVTRKKWIARRSLRRCYPSNSGGGFDNECPDVDVVQFLRRLDQIRIRMASTDYFKQAMIILGQSLLALPTNNLPKRLVCFGIGPFTRNFQAFHQLAFILETQKYYKIREANFFDPIFRDSEKAVLDNLQCTLLRKNCEAKYVADVLTIFYMPHCPNFLTNNLLWSNWRPELLKNIVLINNSFITLSNNKPHRLLRLDAAYILDILSYAMEFTLKDIYPIYNVFNDLSVHVFPVKQLPPINHQIWEPKEEPSYTDVELISEIIDNLEIL